MTTKELTPGTLLQGGKYKIIKTLGQGGFGITYLAEQTALDREVCIKEFFMKEYGARTGSGETTVLTAVTSAAGEIMGRYRDKFVKEAKTIARLEHPEIVRIHDVFEENGTAYYVMDYIEGENLNDYVKKHGPISEVRALKYIRQVADALSYVHGQKIMHLDVKPSNIIVQKSDDRAILIDFGASKQYDISGTQTSTTPVGLSIGYAPIELMRAGGVQTFSPETDVYSLGATLYYLVTGKNPPEAGDVLEDGLPPLPASLSSGLRRAVSEAMKPRKQRPGSVKEFVALLEGPVEKKQKKSGWRTVAVFGAIALVFAIIVGLRHDRGDSYDPVIPQNSAGANTTSKGLYPEGSTRYLNHSDLVGKSSWQLRIMRNEIYARHGFIFQSQDLRDYFGKQSWYSGYTTDAGEVYRSFSAIEKANVDLIKSYE